MTVLADTNVIIDFWKHPSDELRTFFGTEDVVLCGVVVAELLHGALSEKNLNQISSLISCFRLLSISEMDWANFGVMLYRLRSNGVTVPFQDALIAYIAINNNVPLKTKDKHFQLIRTVLPDLCLYEQPQDSI